MRYGASPQALQPRSAGQRRPEVAKKHSAVDEDNLGRKHRPDYTVVVIIGALLAIGAVVVYAIGPGLTLGTDLAQNYYSSKQLTAIALGIGAFLAAAFTPITKWRQIQPFIIGAAAIVALSVRFVGEEINGAHRWIQFAGFSFQAAELVKFAIVLWLAAFLAQRRIDKQLGSIDTLKNLGLLVAGVIVVVAGMQSDLGSAVVMMAVIAGVAFIAGMPIKRLIIVGFVVLSLAIAAIVATPYRRDRVATFFNPTADCQAEGYQACQALITVGSGGIAGKGVGRSVQAYGYLPEPANDSVFAITAEKFGFIGTTIILGLFATLFSRIARVAQRAPTDYTQFLVVGVLVWLSVQMLINVGAMVGLLPLKGITLPFISYGGTSIIFVMAAMGIVFQVSRYTDLNSKSAVKSRQTNSYSSNRATYRRPA